VKNIKQSRNTDFVIVGAGILGLSMARQLIRSFPKTSITIVEKEKKLGLHASGRNSGVLHSGIYYKEGSLKSILCAEGSLAMSQYCDENRLLINRVGKVIVPSKESDDAVLDMLQQRARSNGAQTEIINAAQLRDLEPNSTSATGRALFSPDTAVVDSKGILKHLMRELERKGVNFIFSACCQDICKKTKSITLPSQKIHYGHLYNTAGLFADKLAKYCDIGLEFTMLPFKGLYFELSPHSMIQINHLVYPVPDMNMPFLGVHFTKTVEGKVYIGPTAIPALGREHYKGISGINVAEMSRVIYELCMQYLYNKQGFRHYVHSEASHLLKSKFVDSARKLIPNLKPSDFISSTKVGIRAQLLDTKKRELVMDFMVKYSENETHILNAVSPAFTSAFSFSKYIIERQYGVQNRKRTPSFLRNTL
jgi:L-2-hydroxyglutarate oxidase LhgO